MITNGPMSLWPLNAASDSTNPSFNEFSQIRSFSCVPQTLSGGAIDFVSSTEVKKRTESIKQLLNRLDHRLMTLKNVSKEVHATLIFLLDPHTDMHPIWFPDFDPPNFNSTSISQWTLSVASKHPEVIIWDSHLHLTNVYRQICRKSCATKGKWEWRECRDIVHPSISVMRHYATMLMNFICHTL